MVFQTGLFFLCWKGLYRENQGILLIYPSVHSGDCDRDQDFEKSKCNCKQTFFEGSCNQELFSFGPGYVITLSLTWMFCSDGLYKDSDPYISQPNASRLKIFKR